MNAVLQQSTRWYVALGSNMGESLEILRAARRMLAEVGTGLEASAIYRSAPMYELDQPDFLNAVVALENTLDAKGMLAAIQHIELVLGRERSPARRYGPRRIDLDIAAGVSGEGAVVVDEEELCIPHPRMHERGFVLQPLAELSASWIHPLLGLDAEELLARVVDDAHLVCAYQPSEWQ